MYKLYEFVQTTHTVKRSHALASPCLNPMNRILNGVTDKLADDSTMAKMNERLELEAELGLTMKGLAMAKDTQIEQDQYTYNSTVDRVRTPPPMHNRK